MSCLGVSPRLGPLAPQEQTSPAGKPPGSVRLAQPRKSRASRTGAQGWGVWGPCRLLPTLGCWNSPPRQAVMQQAQELPVAAPGAPDGCGGGWTPGCSPGATPGSSAAFCLHKPCSPLAATHASPPARLPGSTLSFSVWNHVFQGKNGAVCH